MPLAHSGTYGDESKAVVVTPSAALLFVSSTDQGGGKRRLGVTVLVVTKIVAVKPESSALRIPGLNVPSVALAFAGVWGLVGRLEVET